MRIWRSIVTIVGLALATPEERVARLERRLQRACLEYVRECRSAPAGSYEDVEQHAWRRLLGQRAEIAEMRRRIAGVPPVREALEPADPTPLRLPSIDTLNLQNMDDGGESTAA